MPDHPTHHDQPSQPTTAATDDHASTDPAPKPTATALYIPAATIVDKAAADNGADTAATARDAAPQRTR
jgi:hypothetical protein